MMNCTVNHSCIRNAKRIGKRLQLLPLLATLTMAFVSFPMECPAAPAPDRAQGCNKAPCVVVLQDELYSDTSELPELPGDPDSPSSPKINSCEDLLAALHAGTDLGIRKEFPEFNSYLNCLAAAVIAQGKGTAISRFDLSRAGQQILTQLDMGSIRSSLGPSRPAEHYRLTDFKFSRKRVGPNNVELVIQGFKYRFKVIAAGDFRHIGTEELFVRFDDYAINGGSYDASSLLILNWEPNSGAIIATDALDVLRK